ncbi:MAG: four helix bundle protein [Bacteroidales bacterium]|nr:four helix bundle protein [Bacteroidales bacterium]
MPLSDQQIQYRESLKKRTKDFALRVIKLYQALPKTGEAYVIGKQLLRSATSVGANYRAACRARSKNECISKISIVIEETDESMYWIELLIESGIMEEKRLKPLYEENEEILKMIVHIRSSLRNSQE